MNPKIKLTLLTSAISLLFVACHTTHKPASGSMQFSQDTLSYNMTKDSVVRDGLSFEKAIIIEEKSELAGVKAENKWLSEHYPNYKKTSQALLTNDEKPFDRISITLSDGKKLEIYFDISSFFGKF